MLCNCSHCAPMRALQEEIARLRAQLLGEQEAAFRAVSVCGTYLAGAGHPRETWKTMEETAHKVLEIDVAALRGTR